MRRIITAAMILALAFQLAAAQEPAAAPAQGTAAAASGEANKQRLADWNAANEAYQKGMAYEKTGQYRNAFREYEKVAKSNINFPQIYKRLAVCYYAFGNYEFAIRYYERYLQHFPNDNIVRQYLSLIHI